MAQLVADGQAHGVPIAAVLTPAEALQSEHLAEVGALVDTELAPGVRARVPVGYWVVDGEHAGYRTPRPGRRQQRCGLADNGFRATGHPVGWGAAARGHPDHRSRCHRRRR